MQADDIPRKVVKGALDSLAREFEEMKQMYVTLREREEGVEEQDFFAGKRDSCQVADDKLLYVTRKNLCVDK